MPWWLPLFLAWIAMPIYLGGSANRTPEIWEVWIMFAFALIGIGLAIALK